VIIFKVYIAAAYDVVDGSTRPLYDVRRPVRAGLSSFLAWYNDLMELESMES
jgi:hypothetical protein